MTGRRVSGFTLIEVLVAIVLLGITAAAALPAFRAQARFNTKMEIKTGAIQTAEQTLDELRLEDPEDLPTSGSSAWESLTVGDRQYELRTSYCVNADYCLSERSRHVVVTVKYLDEEIYELETVFTKLR